MASAEVTLNEDFRVDVYRGGETWIRITHLPTGTVVNVDATNIGTLRAREAAMRELTEKLGPAETLPDDYV